LSNSGTIANTAGYQPGLYDYGGTIAAVTNATGGVISGATTAVLLVNFATIGTLTNSGLISSGNVGINNIGGAITALDNNGTIVGTISDGIVNSGQIVTLDNSGTIANFSTIFTEANAGVLNNASSTITTLINEPSGVISAVIGPGIDNYGSITALTNSGNIFSANVSGVANNGSIGTLTNGGAISGSRFGVANIGFIDTFSNELSGNVFGPTGVFNSGVIDLLSNSGNISSGEGGTGGLTNNGSIATLTNRGVITGPNYGIWNQNGTIDTLVIQASGLVSSALYGLYNLGATIGTLDNSGTIENVGNTPGATFGGVVNSSTGTITSLINEQTGVVSAAEGSAIYNSGTIGALTNAGQISGPVRYGIANTNFIGTLTNQIGGQIYGNYSGIINQGLINLLSNAGSISAPAGNTAGISNAGSIGTLTNSGIISGPEWGIWNYNGTIDLLAVQAGGLLSGSESGLYNQQGTIGALTNSGTITGGSEGIDNGYNSTLGSLDNLAGGVISGGQIGVLNGGATIGELTNSGTITGAANFGIYNTGTIGQVSNTNLVAGGIDGIDNDTATITVIGNSGVISGGTGSGIANNGGFIGAITNSGNITGGADGIFNAGTIGTIANSGAIYGATFGIYNGTIAAPVGPDVVGVVNRAIVSGDAPVTPAVIGLITNTGSISGLTGIYLTGGGTTIVNAGTIASTDNGDAIYFGGTDFLTLTTGSVIEGTIDGGGSASQIVLDGTGAITSEIADFGPGSALNVDSGGNWTGTGNWTVASVTNDGILQGGIIGTPLNLTGDFVQNADGTLRVVVTPAESSEFNITGAAALAGGVDYLLAPGSYTPHTYTYLTATNGITGAFTNVNDGVIPPGAANTHYEADPSANLVITEAFIITTVTVGNAGTIAAGPGTVTTVVGTVSSGGQTFLGASGTGSVVAVAILVPGGVVAPADDAIFSDATQEQAAATQEVTDELLGKANGHQASTAACAAEEAAAPASATPGAGAGARIAAALGAAFCHAGGWVEATGTGLSMDGNAGAAGYHADTGGFMAGVDAQVTQYGARLGLAVGYDETWLHDSSGGKVTVDTTRAGLYGAQPLGRLRNLCVA
jgi:hypothetical protein